MLQPCWPDEQFQLSHSIIRGAVEMDKAIARGNLADVLSADRSS
jgi:hypothetical protein